MSALGRTLRESVVPQTIGGALTGTGTLAIPAGVLEVTVTGAGGPGGNDYAYNPGQPYIAEVAYDWGQTAAPAVWEWALYGSHGWTTYNPQEISLYPRPTASGQTIPVGVVARMYHGGFGQWYYNTTTNTGSSLGGYSRLQAAIAYRAPSAAGQRQILAGWYWSYSGTIYEPFPGQEYDMLDPLFAVRPTGAGQTIAGPVDVYRTPSGAGNVTVPSLVSLYHAGQSPVPAVAGQPYIAPSSTGGPYTGASTTCTLNGTTKTFVGGYNATPAASATYALTSTGAGQTLSYSIPTGGSLSYSYQA